LTVTVRSSSGFGSRAMISGSAAMSRSWTAAGVRSFSIPARARPLISLLGGGGRPAAPAGLRLGRNSNELSAGRTRISGRDDT
jgi:hypothetical protein